MQNRSFHHTSAVRSRCSVLYRMAVIRGRLLLCLCLLLGTTGKLSADDGVQFFEQEIRPLLIEQCISCHGEQEQSGGLRLDSRAAILKGGDSGPAAIPGKVDVSRISEAIRYDGKLQMPPEKPLTAAQQAALNHWIAEGMPWPEQSSPLKPVRVDAAKTHWAFQPVSDPQVPSVESERIVTAVDSFLQQKLQQAGLSMSPEADRRTLIRRLCYTLTGLPPSPESVEQFVASSDPQVYEKLVDKFLESKAYGEHWARHWLDIARYSDTKGYVYAREERFWVHAWNYRDWVVRALNSDMPYDRFLLLQIAADQVADRSAEDLAAMGFLTLGRRFLGVRRDIIDDQIDVLCRGTMSLTVGCARCHDHKYDPIPTADYYSLYGVFDSSREALVQLPGGSSDEAFDKTFEEKSSAMDAVLQRHRQSTAARVRERTCDYLRAQLDLGRYPEEGFDQIIASSDLLPSFVRRWRDYLRDAERTGDPVFRAWHSFRTIPPGEFSQHAEAVTKQLQALPAEQINPLISAAFSTVPASFDVVIERYAEAFRTVDVAWQSLLSNASAEGRPLPVSLVDNAAEQLRNVLYAPGGPCYVPDEPVVSTEYDFDSGTCNELWKQQVELDRLILNAPSQPRFAVILRDRVTPVTPRVFRRGNPANKGEDVPRQFLSLLSGADRQPFQQGSGRLELAKAIIDPHNPLTARVLVNRVWAHHFGTGLVSTPGDFGLRADPPSHPELLDWLTVRFMESGWSIKALHRLILLSAAFRQSSTGPLDDQLLQEAQVRDPANRMLWRMNTHRLTFEEMRDSMLFASGQLDLAMGGKPAELFRSPYPVRRTLYGLVDRQFLPGALRIFDFANPDLHIPQRSETTVPQQSLFLMNHPIVLEQVHQLAARVSSEGSAEQQVRAIFRSTLQREPLESQLTGAMELLAGPSPVPESPAKGEKDWSYGYGVLDEELGKTTKFTLLPHFTGTAWQGGPAFPDPVIGWVQLSAKGGHPGNDREHAVIRRWTAPTAMSVQISGVLQHDPAPGDGIRAFVVSSVRGVLTRVRLHQQRMEVAHEPIDVQAGETLDFIVDIDRELNSDQFDWEIEITQPGSESAQRWNSTKDFPTPPNPELTPLEQLVQVLFCSNEFLFVD